MISNLFLLLQKSETNVNLMLSLYYFEVKKKGQINAPNTKKCLTKTIRFLVVILTLQK